MLKEETGTVLKQVNPLSMASEANISKCSESRYGSEDEVTSSKTLEALKRIKDDEFLNQFWIQQEVSKQLEPQVDDKENSNSINTPVVDKNHPGSDKKLIGSQKSWKSDSSQNSTFVFKSGVNQINHFGIDLGSVIEKMPNFDPKQNYYQLYWKTFTENKLLLEQLKLKSEERNNNLKEIIKMNMSGCASSVAEERKGERKKHFRRTAKEITKKEKCPYANCGKFYGSEGSLNLHVKLKHYGGNKTDREKLAKSLIIAYSNSKELPEVTLNLPPGLLEEENKKWNACLTDEQLASIQKYVSEKFKDDLK